ncbi:hypothetical protein [Trinickia dinghuensis]|uniref:Uncharacterized protein n=1 Tax=Trinickia dinghuensis TaxID=2291023 RepID=A0A3D8K2U5_9BURK|nr:hypothetical protein [Trinickia dinghuensis]RDU99216.1 hypothetical protein DWV00_08815 [Trinickia dinghuensis]
MPDVKYSDWAPEEDAVLKRLWLDGMPTKRIVDELPGRTYSSIAKRRGVLELPRRSGAGVDPKSRPEMQKIWNALKKRRATRAQLEQRAKVAHTTVSRFVKLFRGEIHICAWKPTGPKGELSEVLKAGSGKDVEKPDAATSSERSHRWWERCKREKPIYVGRRLARDAVLKRERQGTLAKRDIAAVALFGDYAPEASTPSGA